MNWFKNLKLANKINIVNGSVIVITLIISGYILLGYIYETSVNQAKDMALVEAELGANKVKREIEITKTQLVELRDSILFVRNNNFSSRQEITDYFKIILNNNKNILGIYTIWEPDKFDGKDKEFANTPYHDNIGRFIPYIVRIDDKIVTLPLHDYNTDGIGDWYLNCKKTKKITLTEPFYYHIKGKYVLLASLVVPLIDNEGEFIGLVGADFKVDFLQQFIKTIQPLK
ncbi:MAG: cache domain-containing protein, partial [Vampirovibrionia bacterium]